jgi:hypothetical protein
VVVALGLITHPPAGIETAGVPAADAAGINPLHKFINEMLKAIAKVREIRLREKPRRSLAIALSIIMMG